MVLFPRFLVSRRKEFGQETFCENTEKLEFITEKVKAKVHPEMERADWELAAAPPIVRACLCPWV